MNTITGTLVPPLTAQVRDNEPLASVSPSVSPGSLNGSATASTPTYVDKPTASSVSAATGIRLSPKQQLMADLEVLMGEYLEIFTMSRLAAREHNAFTVMSMMRMVELAAVKMLSSALAEFIGGLVKGGAGIVSGGMQVYSACKSLQALKSEAQGMKAALENAKTAENKLTDARSAAANAADEAGKADANAKVKEAQQEFDLANQRVMEKSDITKSFNFIESQANADKWTGWAAFTKNLGELLESICKYYSSGVEKDKMLIEAMEKYLQGAQQNNQEFERGLAEMVRQLLDQLKSKIDSEHQVNMNTAQNV